ncbi:hypothetical protein [Stutzerimonas xanthomarina]|uniref:hypothetical protein n=1 Tax=Stutzerimonas xanthomarina TaxID=271420 RepID=UPI003AA9A8DC
MNLTGNIVFLKIGNELTDIINLALQDTCRVIHDRIYPNSDYRYFDVSQISAGGRNPNLYLSFLKFFLNHNFSLDDIWVRKVYKIISTKNDDFLLKHSDSLLKDLGIKAIQPKAIAYQCMRGLHIFLIALWARIGIQLPISFSLPQTTVWPEKQYKGNYKLDTAYELYPPLLKIIRKPFQKNIIDHDTPDLISFIPTTSLTSYRSLAWRPIIASSWQTLNDINAEELNSLFEALIKRRKDGVRSYSLSAKAWLMPLYRLAPHDLNFEISEIRQIRRASFPPALVYRPEYNAGQFRRQRDSWRIWTSNYVQMLLETGRVKKTVPTEASLADLATYLLTTLPKHDIEPPIVELVTRDHIDGFKKAPPFRAFVKKATTISHLSGFFDYVSKTLKAQGRDFPNPITKYDKPYESKPAITDKKTFSFNEFREFFSLSYALLGFIEYILYTILEGSPPPEWKVLLRQFSNGNAIVDTEVIGYTPFITYVEIGGHRHLIPLRFIPFKLLCLEHLPIRTSNGQEYRLVPTPDCIASIITALETSIRFIHIRWLDRLLLNPDYPTLGDDYIAASHRNEGGYFNLFVNTDKSGAPWSRPTSTRLLRVFSLVARYKKHIALDHFDTPMQYTHHDLTHYPMITALFCHNSDKTVLRESAYRSYYKMLVYFFNQIRLANGQVPLDCLPSGIQDLQDASGYQTAYDLRHSFTTNYTPHGIRATVISLSSTFLSDEHIGKEISGHKKSSVCRYVVINKQLVSDVSVLTDSKIISALSWDKADVYPSPASAEELLHSTFSIQSPNGEMLTAEEILQKHHMLSAFSTHFCLAKGSCPSDIVQSIGKKSCGQCYLGLKSLGHLPAILAYIRRLSTDMDELQSRIKAIGETISDVALKSMEERFIELVNEFSAWTLTAQHMIKNTKKLQGNFMTVSNGVTEFKLAEFAENRFVTDILTRMSDAVTYPELASSSLKADIFRLSAKLMNFDASFSSLFSIEEDQQLLHEMKGRLESLMIANNFSIKQIEGLLDNNLSVLPPQLAAL